MIKKKSFQKLYSLWSKKSKNNSYSNSQELYKKNDIISTLSLLSNYSLHKLVTRTLKDQNTLKLQVKNKISLSNN
jgi:hypothetical protein